MPGRRFLAFVAAAMLVTSLAPAPVLGASPERVHVLIRFNAPPTAADVAGLKGLGADVTRRFRIVAAVAATVPETALAGISRNPRVAVVEPDSLLYAVEYGSARDWGVAHVRADEVHATGNLGAGVRVAVIDSGIDCDHVELAASCEHGWNYVAETQNADDDYGHGTHVAGTVAAALHETATGVVGVAPEATVVAYKTLDAAGVGAWSRHIAAIDDIWNGGMPTADIVNMSIGRGDYSSIAEEAMQRAYEAGILLVAAAGNSGKCSAKGDNVSYPALFPSVIAVAAIDSANARPCWSSTGAAVELSAPGVSVFSTWPSDMSASYLDPQPFCEDGDGDGDLDCHYKFGSGTSMSAPHVAGAAALVLAAGALTNEDGLYGVANELRQQLVATAVDLGTSGRDPQYGYGLVDAFAASGGGGVEPPPGGITLTARPYVVRKVLYVDLAWSGAAGDLVAVHRDGVVVATVDNDGSHTDRIGRVSGGTYVYRICETDTIVCSVEVSVSF